MKRPACAAGASRQSGFAIIFVMALLVVFSGFAGIATVFLRPAAASLDMHHCAGRAQLLAESAVQEALARQQAGRPVPFDKGFGVPAGEWESAAVAPAGEGEVDVTATGKVRELAGARRLWISAAIRVRFRKNAAGVWQVAAYSPASPFGEPER